MNRQFFSVYLLIAGLLIGPFCASAQPATNGGAPTYLRAIYRIDYKLDSVVAAPKNEQMLLLIKNRVSCFRHKSNHILDSVFTNLNGQPKRLQAAADAWSKAGVSTFNYTIFKEPAKDLVFYHDRIVSQDYQYQEKAPLFHWQLMPTKQVVAGYECQQAYAAFGGRMWEAWFTRDIPVSEGPYKFYGLPGLIVKVRDTHDNYVFELLSFESNPKPFDISATSPLLSGLSASAPIIKKAKFKQAKDDADATIFDQFAASGNIIPEGMQRDYFAKLKRQNNPLELK